MENDSSGILQELDKLLHSRVKKKPGGSYVTALLEKNEDEVLRKIGEEATELMLAAKGREGKVDKQSVIAETADLWFHTMVALAREGLSVNDVIAELKSRREKNRRKKSGRRE